MIAGSIREETMSEETLGDVEIAVSGPGDAFARPTWVRYQVLAAACAMAVITYIHRVGFARASAEFKESLGLSDGQVAHLMAAFMIGYGLFEMPWGFLGDRFGVRSLLVAIMVGGSSLTACLALVAFFPVSLVNWVMLFLIVLRFLFGTFQAGTFPAISRMTADWMPTIERGRAQGAIWMSSRMGGALAPLLLGGLIAVMGDWKLPLVMVACLGFLWCALFWPWFRNRPEEMPQVNLHERKLIKAGQATQPAAGHAAVPWARMLRTPSVWALCFMYGFLGFSGNFYITMLPSYLKNHRHLGPGAVSWLTSLPFAFGVGACLIGGWFSDAVIRRWGRQWGRRLVGATGLAVAGISILAVPLVEDTAALGLLLALAFFGNDLSMAPAWAAAADIGERHAGVLSGAMNMMSSFMAALQALAVGYLLDAHDLVTPFIVLAGSYALGTIAWIGVDVRKSLGDAH
jgi:sugar phosphate permease